ncbi:N-acetylmuramic acid 6-phosphate etherase [Microbacterium gorillae]|uniref:N-acetylmuramic acid 6-phosphate etherase n=1 Tax=Microbacterium gorillae TaxID=1231063 RepID=UPI00058C5990|nr:N-acetylmuramic acid 6-phosphate etherase [Microbacterium gorillae]
MPDRTLDALRDTLATLDTEAVSDAGDLDVMTTAELVAAMNRENARVPAAVEAESAQIAAAVDMVAERMPRGGRLLYVGAGTAGRIGVLDASEIPPTFGTAPGLVVGVMAGGDVAIRTAVENAEDDAEAGAATVAAHGVGPDDVLVGISASGRTPYVRGALAAANAVGAGTVAIANNRGSEIGAVAQIAIEVVVGPELVSGSTRLKAGTAQKLVVNAISTLAMIKLGKVYGSLMVDLRATNEKLRARSQRTVMTATGATAAEATDALDAAHGWIKAAILVRQSGLSATEALLLLDDHGGRLRAALDSTKE